MNYNSKSFNHSCQQIVQQFGNAIIAGTNNIPFSVIAIALFGSYALNQNTDDSDIDLLVVADGINPKLHKRAKEIIILKKMLSIGIPTDIILVTKSECQDNFYNHNPLFLDIAYDGIVIIDTNCFLQSLIDETKAYIITNKLQKYDDGWRFPVIHRHATFLSSISNKDFAKAMLADGKRDYGNYDSEDAIEIRTKANIVISTADDFITQWFID